MCGELHVLRCKIGRTPASYPREGQSHPSAGSRRRQGPDESPSRRWGRKRSCLWEALTGQAREARPHVPKGNQGPRQGVVCRKCACIWIVRFIKGKTCLTISLKRDSPNTSLLFIILSTPKPTVTQGHSLPCSASSCPRNSALCRGQTGKDGNTKTPMAVTVGLGSYSTSKGMNRNSTEPMLQAHSNKNSTWLFFTGHPSIWLHQ